MDMKMHACIAGKFGTLVTAPSAIQHVPTDSAVAELARKSGKGSAVANLTRQHAQEVRRA